MYLQNMKKRKLMAVLVVSLFFGYRNTRSRERLHSLRLSGNTDSIWDSGRRNRFIHDAKTDAQRDVLFKEMRTGKKRVLIGSTDKCGTGVNVQTHLVALHHVDCPWKPLLSNREKEGESDRAMRIARLQCIVM